MFSRPVVGCCGLKAEAIQKPFVLIHRLDCTESTRIEQRRPRAGAAGKAKSQGWQVITLTGILRIYKIYGIRVPLYKSIGRQLALGCSAIIMRIKKKRYEICPHRYLSKECIAPQNQISQQSVEWRTACTIRRVEDLCKFGLKPISARTIR